MAQKVHFIFFPCTTNTVLIRQQAQGQAKFQCGTCKCRKVRQKGTYGSDDINDGDFLLRVVLVFLPSLFRHQGPQFVQVDCWLEMLVLPQVEVSHTNLSKAIHFSKKFSDENKCGVVMQGSANGH